MQGLLDRYPRFSVVIAHIDDDRRQLEAAVRMVEARILRSLQESIGRFDPGSAELPGVLDELTLWCLERKGLESTCIVLQDEDVQAALPALREAWNVVKDQLTPHEMEKMLRDPPFPSERHSVRDVRVAWYPVGRAGERALAAMTTDSSPALR